MTKKLHKIITGFAIVLLSISLSGEDKLSNLSWLVGEWKSRSGTTIITERWDKISGNTFEGYGETRNVSSDKIISSETLRIVEMSGDIYYIAKVAHNEYPIAFKLTEQDDTSLVFINLLHDFPQKIKYTLSEEDQLTVDVSNEESGFSIKFFREE